ncbi:TCP-1/cpn60 chaperonin family protein [archaeon]|nr:TCP-1/cpn60 chaperonin family protein [archaeon]
MASAPALTGTPILILKEGTTRTKGRAALRVNILAARIIADALRTSLGPRGMDKMLVDSFGDVTITNDGATILDEMEVQHPAAKMMVEVAKTQDHEVGDGTTTACILAGFLLDKAEPLINRDVHPTIIADAYKKAFQEAIKALDKYAIRIDPEDREWLLRIARVAVSTKSSARAADFLAKMAVEAILTVAEKLPDGRYKVDVDDVKIEKKAGGSLEDSRLVKGIVIDKEVVHPDMPKLVKNARIAILNCPLEIEKPEFDAKIRISSPEQMKAFMDAETEELRKMVEKLKSVGANVVITQKGIDDTAQHFLAKAEILAVRRVKSSDIEKLAKATGGRIVTNIEDITEADLGRAERVYEEKVGEDRMVFIEGCADPKSVTILVRGSSDRLVDEYERATIDALNVVKDILIDPRVVVGGGAIEMAVACHIRDFGLKLKGKEQLAVQAFAEALEEISIALAESCGIDPIEAVTELRSHHEQGRNSYGIDVINAKIADIANIGVYEPAIVKLQAFKSAVDAACMILRIDDIVAASRLEEKEKEKEEKEEEETKSSEFEI